VLHRLGPLGGNGVLAGAHPAGFADAIVRLLDQPATAKAIGASSAERAAQHTPAHYGRAISEVYHYACARAGSFNIRGRTRR
jgi:hypothetical protein